MLKCRVFGGKTGPFPVGRVFRVVRRVSTVRFRVEPEPESTREFGPVANTTSRACWPAFGVTGIPNDFVQEQLRSLMTDTGVPWE
jgi:hypothetical protein